MYFYRGINPRAAIENVADQKIFFFIASVDAPTRLKCQKKNLLTQTINLTILYIAIMSSLIYFECVIKKKKKY